MFKQNHNNEGKFLIRKKTKYPFLGLLYRWWTKIWEQSEGEVWNGGPQNIMPIIFMKNNLSTVQFRSDDGVWKVILTARVKNLRYEERNYGEGGLSQ